MTVRKILSVILENWNYQKIIITKNVFLNYFGMILDLENSLWQFYFCTFSQNTIISFKYVDFWSEIMLLRTHIWKSSIFQSFNQSCSLNIHWLKDYLVDGQKLSYAVVRSCDGEKRNVFTFYLVIFKKSNLPFYIFIYFQD